MKTAAIMGVVLVVLGALLLAYQGITYTTRKKVVEVGPIQATKKEHRTVDLPPIFGATVLAAGVACVVVASRKR